MKRSGTPVDGNMLYQKALNVYEDLSKGPPETRDHNHVTFIRVHCYKGATISYC